MKSFNIIKRLVESFFNDTEQMQQDLDDVDSIDAVQIAKKEAIHLGSIMYYDIKDGKNFHHGMPIAICVVEPGQLDMHPRFMMLHQLETNGKNGTSAKRCIFGGKVSSVKGMKKYAYDKYSQHDHIYDIPCMKSDVDGEKNTQCLLASNDPANPYKAAEMCVSAKYDIIYQDAKGAIRCKRVTPERQYMPTAAEIITAQDNLKEVYNKIGGESQGWATDGDGTPVFSGWNIKRFLDGCFYTSTCLTGNQVFYTGSHPRWRLIESDLTETHEVWPFIKP